MSVPPVDDPEALKRVMDRAKALFLDFDGPVCDLFAGLPPSVVADQLCVVLADSGYGDLPPDIEKSSDPFDVLRFAAKLGRVEADHVNAVFMAHEAEAVATAMPTPGANHLIRAWSATGHPLAIVSNNSRMAIESYLDLHDLRSHVSYISGRAGADPTLLKPSPYLLVETLSALGIQAFEAIFIGDSVSDLAAGRHASITSIGYANKPRKVDAFADRPAAIVTNLARLLPVIGTGN